MASLSYESLKKLNPYYLNIHIKRVVLKIQIRSLFKCIIEGRLVPAETDFPGMKINPATLRSILNGEEPYRPFSSTMYRMLMRIDVTSDDFQSYAIDYIKYGALYSGDDLCLSTSFSDFFRKHNWDDYIYACNKHRIDKLPIPPLSEIKCYCNKTHVPHRIKDETTCEKETKICLVPSYPHMSRMRDITKTYQPVYYAIQN